jgi:hypothetical protein
MMFVFEPIESALMNTFLLNNLPESGRSISKAFDVRDSFQVRKPHFKLYFT